LGVRREELECGEAMVQSPVVTPCVGENIQPRIKAEYADQTPKELLIPII